MATPQELQNALMLKKANPNLTTAQAVNQSRVPVTATSQINQDQLAKNQALRQAPQVPATPIVPPAGTTTPNGATLNANGTIANAPLPTEQQINAQYGGVIQDNGINSVQPINAPTEMPAQKAEPVKPVTPTKVEPVIDFNKSQGREQDIQTNIKQITTDNPALLKDRNAYNQAFGYDTADQGKKAMLDASFNTGNQVPTASAMYNNIIAKADIPEEMKQTPSYRIANNRYMKANMYSTMTPSQLSSEMTNSKLIQGSQAYEDLKAMNPKLVQDTENLRIVNGSKQNIFTTVNNPDGTPVKVNNLEESFKSDFEDNFGDFIKQMYAVQTPEQIRAIIYTPDAQQANDKATAIELEMNELEKQIDNVDSDVDTEMKGSGATGSRIALEKAIRKDKLEKSYNSALKNYTTYANKANSIINQNTTIFQEQQKQQQQQNAAMLPFLQDQYKTEQEKIAKEAALNDPATQIGATMKQFEDLGIVSQGDIGSKLQEFKDSGLTLPEYIKGLRKLYMEKPEYQKYQALQQGQLSDADKFRMQNEVEDRRDLRNFAQQKELARLNKDLSREQFLFELENDPEKKAKALELEQKLQSNKSLFDVLGKNVGTYEGNRGYDLAGSLGDPLPAGGNWTVKSIDNAGEQVGSIFVGGKGSKPYGNTVVMVDENGNEIRYSHLQNIGVKPGDVLGFGDLVGTRGNTGNVMGANGEKLTAEQLKAGRGAHLDVEIKNPQGKLLSNSDQVNFLKGLKAGGTQQDANALAIANGVGELSDLTPTDKKTILPQLENIVKSRMTGDKGRDAIVKSSLYKKDVSDSTLQKMTDMQTVSAQLDGIESRLAKQNVGPILGQIRKLNPYDTDAQVALAELAGITPKVARGIFGEVGVLTDADIANYQRTLPNLTSTEDKNKFAIEIMRNLLAKGVMNTIETQARGQRNMSPFLDVYDSAKANIDNKQNNSNSTYTQKEQVEFDSLYNSL